MTILINSYLLFLRKKPVDVKHKGMTKLVIGWTTVPTKEVGRDIAQGLLKERLVACVHIEGPFMALFYWNEELEQAEEYKLTIKFPSGNEEKIEKWLKIHHPYELPQWYTVTTDHVSKEYFQWATKVGIK